MYDEGRYDEGQKFEQLDKPSSASDFIENSLVLHLSSSILLKFISMFGQSLFYLYQHDSGSRSRFTSSSFVYPNSRSSSAKGNQVSFHDVSKPWFPVFQQHTGTQPVSCY